MRNLRLAILAVAALSTFGCASLCDLLGCQPNPNPTPTPTPTPTPKPTPAPAEQCHLMDPPAVCGCYDNPPNGEAFPEWEANWGYVCCTPEGTVRVGTPEACPTEPAPLPQPQCPTFVNRGGLVDLMNDACDCYAGEQWIPCDPQPPSGCTFPQGVPEDHFTHHPDFPNTLGSTVNGVMSNLSGCSVGSDCPLPYEPDEWMGMVNERLREMGYCAGRHNETPPGATDQISVSNAGSFCDIPSQNFQIYNYGGNKARWSPGAYQGAWEILPQDCATGPEPPVGDCPAPIPPKVGKFNVKPHGNWIDATSKYYNGQAQRWDGTTIAGYCAAIQNPNLWCPARNEGNEFRQVCDRVGVSGSDTGKPLWRASQGGVTVNPNNDWQAKCNGNCDWIEACATDGSVCGRHTF